MYSEKSVGLGKGDVRVHSGSDRRNPGHEGLCHVRKSGLYSVRKGAR